MKLSNNYKKVGSAACQNKSGAKPIHLNFTAKERADMKKAYEKFKIKSRNSQHRTRLK